MANPKLWTGVESPQSIYEATTVQNHAVGSRAGLDDGRVFYYSRYSGAAILVAGQIAMSELGSVDWDDLATNTAVAGDKKVNVTPVGTKTYAAGELAGGYVCLNSGTTAQGPGMTYKIAGNPLTVAATAVDLELFDQIAVTFNADVTATVMKNPWMDPVVAATGTAHTVIGVPGVDIPIGSTTAQFGWLQTWGYAAVQYDILETAGMVQVSGTTTAGQIQDSGASTEQPVGINYFASVAGDFCPTFLQIAP